MSSLLVASRQLCDDYLIQFVAQLINPMIVLTERSNPGNGVAKEPAAVIRVHAAAETLGLATWLCTMFQAALIWFLVGIVVLLVLIAVLHRPLPKGIADRKKIHLLEFVMRISNEYMGNLVELVAGPVVRNRFTRLVAFIPFWLFQRGPPKWCLVRTQRIAGIRCRMYLPQGATRRSNAAIVFIHGGGWCMGRPRFYDGTLLRIIKKLGLPIVSIDYSLSPEVKFPSALLECERVLEELYKINFNEIGVDGSKVALMGDSAGGNVCAVLCQRAMRRHRTSGNNALMPKCQILVYPVIHMLDFQSPSYLYYYQSYRGTGLLNPTMLIRWYLLYLGIEPTRENIRIMATNRHLSKELREDKKLMGLVDHSLLPRELPGHKWQLAQKKKQNEIETSPSIEINSSETSFPLCLPVICQNNNNKVADVNVLKEGQERDVMANRMAQLLRNPDLCPVIADDLHDVCPALICTAGIDILRDEGILYAQRLSHFGVPVDWKHYESAYHGILNMGKSAKRAQILNDICDYLQKNLL